MVKRLMVFVLTAVALVLITSSGTPFPTDIAHAQGTDEEEATSFESSNEIDPRMVKQMPLADASHQIHQLWQEADLEGFTGVSLDNDEGEVILYWKGQVPSKMNTLINSLQTTVPVRVVSSSYSLEELLVESKRLVELETAANVKVTQAGPLSDFSGIRVGVETIEDHDRAQAEKMDAVRQAVASDFPLEFRVASEARSLRDRWDDASPFYGGAAIDHLDQLFPPKYGYCSTGFAVTTDSGTEGMLTAAHCKYGWDYYTPEGDLEVGTVSNPFLCTYDAGTLIGGSYSPRIYVGPWEDSSQSKSVVGWEYPAVNQYVFLSGSSSGEHIVKVESTGQYVDGDCDPWATGPGFWTVDEEGDGSAGTGDSGGPVFRYDSPTTVKGLGIISAGDVGDNEADCEGRSGRICASRVFHMNLGSILGELDLTLQ